MPMTQEEQSSSQGHVPVPHLSLHAAHSAIPGLLKSFPVPTPIGSPCPSALPLVKQQPDGGAGKASAAVPRNVINDIVCSARTSMASNATLIKARVAPLGFSPAATNLSTAAKSVVAALLEDEAARNAMIDRTHTTSSSDGGMTRQSTSAGATVKQRKADSSPGDRLQGSGGMTLRQRTGSALPLEMQQRSPTAPVAAASGRVQGKASPDAAAVKAETSPPAKKKGRTDAPHKQEGQKQPHTSSHTKTELDEAASATLESPLTPSAILPKNFSISECIRRNQMDANSVAALINALPTSSQPFQGVNDDTMAGYLLALVAPAVGNANANAAPSPPDIFTTALYTVACASCLAHGTIDARWLSDDTVNGLLVNAASVVRYIRRRLQQAASDRLAKRSDAEDAKPAGEKATSTTKRSRDAADSAASRRLPPDLTRLLEVVRTMSRRLVAIVADASTGIISDVNVLRVEEIAFSIATCSLEDAEASETVFDYVGRDSLALVTAVWNRIEQGRDAVFSALCDRVPPSNPLILRRLCRLGHDVSVMPLTVVVVAAAQSWPLFASEVTAATVDNFHQQHQRIASHIITRWFAQGITDDGEVRAKFVVQLVEDLCSMLGLPNFPVADALLRSLLTGLSRAYLGATLSSTTEAFVDEAAPDGKDDAKLRGMVVDLVGKIALQLHHKTTSMASAPLEMSSVEDVPFLEEWQHVVTDGLPSKSEHAASAPSSKKPKNAKGAGAPPSPQLRPLTLPERCACTLYTAFTERIAKGDMSTAAIEFHTRRAYVFTWLRTKWIHPSALDTLCRRMSNARKSHIGADMDDDALHAIATYLLTQQAKSALHCDSREALVALLLNAVKMQQNGSAWDTIRKKAMSYVSKLLDAQPSLLRVVWPIALQSVRDDAARVRESCIPMLQRILAAAVKSLAVGKEPAHVLTERRTMAANVFAALCLLLDDRTAVVLSKTLGAVQDIIASTDPEVEALLTTPDGQTMLRYLQTKVVSLLDHADHGKKYHADVVYLFVMRWMHRGAVQACKMEGDDDDDTSVAAVHSNVRALHRSGATAPGASVSAEAMQTMSIELPWLACRWSSAPYELETVGNGAVLLLQELRQLCAGGYGPADGTAHKLQPKKFKELNDEQHIQQAVRQCATSMLQSVISGQLSEPGKTLAALHAIAIANVAWIEHLAEPIASLLCAYDPSVAPNDDDAIRIVQTCRILRTLLQSKHSGMSLPLDKLTHTTGVMITKYCGPFQQRVLVAAIGVLCSAVEVQPTAGHARFLKVWYQHVNGYYCRAAALVSQLASATASVVATQQQSRSFTSATPVQEEGIKQPSSDAATQATIGYISRFTFLLSECLRSYHDWVKPAVAQLLSDKSMTAAGTSNRLATERGGVAVSIQWLVQQLIDCPVPERQRLMPLVVRLVGSLCIADPSSFFRKNEAIISQALEASDDVQQQTQGLMIVRDFLLDEDARVFRAAAQQAAASKGKSPTASTGFPRREPSAEDLNSGMATWVVQRFHAVIVSHCVHSASTLVRQLALETLDVSLQQGLIPPAVLVEPLIALSTDRDNATISERAKRALSTIADRHEETIAPKCASGIIKAFSFLQVLAASHASRDDAWLGSLGVVEATDLQPHASVHDLLFRLLGKHKKHRENVIVGLMRMLTQSAKCQEWIEQQQRQQHPNTTGTAPAPPCGPCLQYIASTVGLLPYAAESDVLLVLSQCSTGIDMNLQSCVDIVAEWQQRRNTALEKEAPRAKRGDKVGQHKKDAAAGAVSNPPLESIVSCIGVLHCCNIKRYLRKEFGISQTKFDKYKASAGEKAGASASTHLPRREPKSKPTAAFLAMCHTLTVICNELSASANPSASIVDQLAALLDDTQQEECAGMILEGNATSAITTKSDKRRREEASKGNKAKKKANTRTAKKGKPIKRRGDNEASSSSDRSDSDSSDSETSTDGSGSTSE